MRQALKRLLRVGVAVWPLQTSGIVMAQDMNQPYVRLAELEIDPAQLEQFNKAVRANIEASVGSEPGCLALYAVALKDSPSSVRVFEMYADTAAYQAHIETAHFKTFADTTKDMVTSRKLMDAIPLVLSAKPR